MNLLAYKITKLIILIIVFLLQGIPSKISKTVNIDVSQKSEK